MGGTFAQIYAIVRQIPAGKVAYYGQIARLAGMPRAARLVGNALAACPANSLVPCHRVVDKQGNTKPAFDTFSKDTQRLMLEAEGVVFLPDGRVDMTKCLWDGRMQAQAGRERTDGDVLV